ncbi:nitrate reductase cytochrome c-type subunit [Rhizobium sp. 18065]|uniref:nitrate reductase cytochrome c-type subunit n=1 Tax=Rhizobium sp. 18065 TaxID=2681411 RepID=UPI001356B343|nr:nitrate reductase cytochrome c-type subunit [Rhizobium sp. 18065]
MRGQSRSNRLIRSHGRILLATGILLIAGTVTLAQMVPDLSGPPDQMGEVRAEPVPKWVVDDVRKMRAYPDQPPVIPHSIEGYQLSINSNRCLSCHKREFTEASGAPMISVTHYMTREGQMIADVSPRRYFCSACHVPQADTRPLIENTFRDMSEMGVKHLGDQ